MGSLRFEQERKNPDARMACGVVITLPAFYDNPELTKCFGTRVFEVDGYKFTSSLKDAPNYRIQTGSGQDKFSFSVTDDDGSLYELFSLYDDVLEDAKVIGLDCYEIEDNVFESEIVMTGFIELFSRPDGELLLNFSSISDMSRQGFLVGGRVISKARCAAKFNINGIENPEFDPCGWTTAQGGNPLFCTHKLEGKDGCIDHNNSDRYFAVEAISIAEVVVVQEYLSGYNGSGWNYYSGRMKEIPEYNIM